MPDLQIYKIMHYSRIEDNKKKNRKSKLFLAPSKIARQTLEARTAVAIKNAKMSALAFLSP